VDKAKHRTPSYFTHILTSTTTATTVIFFSIEIKNNWKPNFGKNRSRKGLEVGKGYLRSGNIKLIIGRNYECFF